jgi:hypothetical protein
MAYGFESRRPHHDAYQLLEFKLLILLPADLLAKMPHPSGDAIQTRHETGLMTAYDRS